MMIVYKVYKNMAFKVPDLLAFSVKMSCFPVVCVVETHSGPVQIISGQHRFHPALVTLHTQACGALHFSHDNPLWWVPPPLKDPFAGKHHEPSVQSDRLAFRSLLSLLWEKEYKATASTKGLISFNLEAINRY